MCAVSVSDKGGCVSMRGADGRGWGESDITQLGGPLLSLTCLKDYAEQPDKVAKPDPVTQATSLLPEELQGQWSRRRQEAEGEVGAAESMFPAGFSGSSGSEEGAGRRQKAGPDPGA